MWGWGLTRTSRSTDSDSARHRDLIALAAFVTVAAACSIEPGDVRTPSGEPLEADTTAVRSVIEAMSDAFDRADLASLDTLYHDSVTVFNDGIATRGWSEFRDVELAEQFSGLRERRLHFHDVRVRLAGNTAWVTCQYTLSGERDGQPVAATGIGTMVLQKLSGGWRLVHVHTSSPEEPRNADE